MAGMDEQIMTLHLCGKDSEEGPNQYLTETYRRHHQFIKPGKWYDYTKSKATRNFGTTCLVSAFACEIEFRTEGCCHFAFVKW